jgi:hypothetical protein
VLLCKDPPGEKIFLVDFCIFLKAPMHIYLEDTLVTPKEFQIIDDEGRRSASNVQTSLIKATDIVILSSFYDAGINHNHLEIKKHLIFQK